MFSQHYTLSTRNRLHSLVKGVVLHGIGTVVCIALASSAAAGQIPTGMTMTLPGGSQIQMGVGNDVQIVQQDAAARVRTPVFTLARVVADKSTHVATVEISNPTADSITVALRMDRTAPLNPDLSLHTDTVPESWSLVGWVKDLPSTIQLAPHAKRKMTFRLDVPTGVKSGMYSGWLIAKNTTRSGKGQDKGQDSVSAHDDDDTTVRETGSRIVYGELTGDSK